MRRRWPSARQIPAPAGRNASRLEWRARLRAQRPPPQPTNSRCIPRGSVAKPCAVDRNGPTTRRAFARCPRRSARPNPTHSAPPQRRSWGRAVAPRARRCSSHGIGPTSPAISPGRQTRNTSDQKTWRFFLIGLAQRVLRPTAGNLGPRSLENSVEGKSPSEAQRTLETLLGIFYTARQARRDIRDASRAAAIGREPFWQLAVRKQTTANPRPKRQNRSLTSETRVAESGTCKRISRQKLGRDNRRSPRILPSFWPGTIFRGMLDRTFPRHTGGASRRFCPPVGFCRATDDRPRVHQPGFSLPFRCVSLVCRACSLAR